MNPAALTRHMPLIDGYPRPDWASIDQVISQLPQTASPDLWTLAARTWLDLTAGHLGPPYVVTESPNFLLLMPFADRNTKLLTTFAEKALRQILVKLEGLAESEVLGKRVIMIFDTQDAYYAYSAHFYSEGEHPLSSGVFLNADYGHIAIPFYDVAETEATLAHELTHNCLRLLPIPLWLNEGLAVTIEDEVCGNRPLRMDADRLRQHQAFWDEATIQEFWSGQSFARVDEGNGLSYELARYCIRALAHDIASFIAFAQHASFEDGGEAAAVEVYGGSLGGLIEQFFGPGNWSPRSSAVSVA
jgi:hypothetical protein